MKLSIFILSLVTCMTIAVEAEIRGWAFKNGKSMDAEYVALSGSHVSLKNVKGKVKKIPVEMLSEEDLRYIELINPPQLNLDLGKKSEPRNYPPTYDNESLPRQMLYTFSARVKQTSSKPYARQLTLEFFNVGEENNGDKNILYSYQKEVFNLGNSGDEFQLTTPEIAVTSYVSYGQKRGETYTGYMIVVTDERGEIIASKTTREEWLQTLENLREVPVGRTFNPKTGMRCRPTRPERFY